MEEVQLDSVQFCSAVFLLRKHIVSSGLEEMVSSSCLDKVR